MRLAHIRASVVWQAHISLPPTDPEVVVRTARRAIMIWASVTLGAIVVTGPILASRNGTPDRGDSQPRPSVPSAPSDETTTQQQPRWSYDVHDEVFAPALVIGDVVVAATHHGAVIALGLDGQRMWKGTLSHGPGYGFGFSPLATSEGLVFASGHDTGLHAFDVASGRVAWRYRGLGRETTGVQVAQGRLFVSGSRGIASLEPSTGRQEWIFPGSYAFLSATGPTRRDVIAYADGMYVGLDPRTGRQRWSIPDSGSVVVRGNVLHRTTTSHRRDREVSAFSLPSGLELWTTPSKGRGFGPPLLAGDRLYASDGLRLHCFEADTGRMLWMQRVSARSPDNQTLILHDDLLYVTTDRGVLALATDDGEEKWRYEAGGEPYSLAIKENTAYLGVHSHLRAIGLPVK